MHLVDNYKNADVVIHNGRFHIDEFLALQFYEIATKQNVAVARVSQVPEDFYGICIDIGDTANRNDLIIFDHHVDKNKNDKSLSACGKVFEYYKDEIMKEMFSTKKLKLAERAFKADILAPIQYQDNFGCPNSYDVNFKKFNGEKYISTSKTISFSSAIQKFNPSFLHEDKELDKFMQAYNYTKEIIKSYCNSLSDRINQGIIRDTPYVSNFHRSTFACDDKLLDKKSYQNNSSDVFYTIALAKNGANAFYKGTRQFTVGDIFTIDNTKLANDFLTDTLKCYEEFQQGYLKGKEIADGKIDEAIEQGHSYLLLDKFVPWRSAAIAANKDKTKNAGIDFAIFPSPRNNGTWNIQTVYENKRTLNYRISFPEELINAKQEELDKFSSGLEFVSEFMSVAKNKDSAIAYAEKLIEGARTLEIPNGTRSTKNFQCNRETRGLVVKLSFPDSLKTIEPRAFQFYTRLKEVTIPKDVYIGTNAFTKCANLKSVTIEPGIKTVGYFAFSDCPKLSNITVPDTLNRLNPNVFFNCDIKNVTISMTSLKNLPNTIKLGETFPDANVTIDCSQLGHDSIPFNKLTEMIEEINAQKKDNVPEQRDKLEVQIENSMKTSSNELNKDDSDIKEINNDVR